MDRRAGAALVAAAAVALAAGLALAGGQAGAEVAPYQPAPRSITVTGTASAQAEPDLLVVRLGVETQEETAAAALASNSELMARVAGALAAAGVQEDGIGTSRLSLHPVYGRYDQEAGRSELVGYRASNAVTAETADLAAAAGVVDGAVAAGANRVDGVSFELSPGRHKEVRDGLIAAAVLDARAKADLALEPLGYRVTGVRAVAISEPGAPHLLPALAAEASDSSFRSAPPVFAPGREVSAAATVSFLMGPA